MKLIRISLAIILSICVAFTVLFGYKKINYQNPDFEQQQYKGLITVWHVDTFEGGKGSRRQFLLDVARSFENAQPNVKIMVINHSITSVEQAFLNGERPDLISFGQGINVNGLIPLGIKNSVVGGVVNDKIYAIPWCRGGYILIAKANSNNNLEQDHFDRIIVSQAEYSCPLIATITEGITAREIDVKQPLDAYVNFVSGKDEILLGTQRDVIRLENRGVEIKTKPLKQYNDLYQYVGITCTQQEKISLSRQYVEFLLSKRVQQSLNKIGMLSQMERVDFENQHLNLLQSSSAFSTLSVFTAPSSIKEIQALSMMGIKGDKDAVNKLKNLLC